MGKSQRSKGTRGELEVVHFFAKYGIELKRVPNSGGLDIKGDVRGLDGWHIEVKRQETASIWAWCKQAEDDCPPDDKPVVIFRRSREPWRVCLSLEDYITLLNGNRDNSISGGPRETEDA